MQEKSNPVFASILNNDSLLDSTNTQSAASFMGISLKTVFLLVLSVVSGFLGIMFLGDALAIALPIALIVGLIAVMVGTFKPHLAAPMSIIYACSQGLLLVLFSLFAEELYPGIAVTAVVVTGSIFASMLVLYMVGVIRGGTKVRRFVMSALVGFLVTYLLSWIMALLGNEYLMELMFGATSLVSLVISVIMVVVGALILTVHFADATKIVEGGYEKKYEWSAALGLLVGIIFLYYRVLILLIRLAGNRR